jgi:hypothetical protein
MAAAKYRPYLTLQQLHYFLQLAEADQRTETEALRLRSIRELKLFIAKNDLGAVKPAFVSVGRSTLEDRLGLDEVSTSSSPEEKRKLSYDLWTKNPLLCNEEQIRQAQLYRYENNLMSPDEESQYENSL